MNVSIETEDQALIVRSPYNTGFIAEARKLAGKWDARREAWVFDVRNTGKVREALRFWYGTDGESPPDTVSVRLWVDGSCGCGPIVWQGRILARAFGRDSGAKLGEGVVVEDGGFTSGGSIKNWDTTTKSTKDLQGHSCGAVVVLHDVPRHFAESDDRESLIVHKEIIVPEAPPAIDAEALRAERARLTDRIAEIDRQLAWIEVEA